MLVFIKSPKNMHLYIYIFFALKKCLKSFKIQGEGEGVRLVFFKKKKLAIHKQYCEGPNKFKNQILFFDKKKTKKKRLILHLCKYMLYFLTVFKSIPSTWNK